MDLIAGEKAGGKKELLYDVLHKHWGYSSFLALQEETIKSILDGTDSLTMLPTGGGKSLCFQLPSIIEEGMTVVISPLISLMKDQVDGLKDMGIAADCLNSAMTISSQRDVIDRIREDEVKLLYISPERLQTEETVSLLRSVPLSFFVIDEAHCISHWGHDFRADYRSLNMIKRTFAPISVHAFTATATKAVQNDILIQLGLDAPHTHIGEVDRPNLTYRVISRNQVLKQITDVLRKHPDEPGIIYCLRRKDVDSISDKLNGSGFVNVPYHAGLTDTERHVNQDKFVREEVDIIVATVAFGMGIDRSNIRFIIHAAMPKSIEHYQQETGRAGRDGLPASCYMFYGGGDYRIWSFFAEKSSEREVMMDKLNSMYNFCARPQCRHRVLVEYFGQEYGKSSCGSCDYCLNELDMLEDPLSVGQKILICAEEVKRGRYGFGAGHIINVLMGKTTEKIENMQHQDLSVFGVMADESAVFIRYMIEQMIGQGFLERDPEYSTLSVTDPGQGVLKGDVVPVLARPLKAAKKKEISRKSARKKEIEWAGVDQKLFQKLRSKRAELAQKKGVPAYIVFSDNALKDMAVKEPLTKEAFTDIYGVGESKLKAYADIFIDVIKQYHLYIKEEFKGY